MNKEKFTNAGLPKDIEQAIDSALKEVIIGRTKLRLLNGLYEHEIQFDPSTVKIAVVDVRGELYATASVIIPLNNDFWLGVEYYEKSERFAAWVNDKNEEICTRGKGGGTVSYDNENLSYCLAMCFSWLALSGCENQPKK